MGWFDTLGEMGVDIGKEFDSPVKNLTDVGSVVSALVSNFYIIGGFVFFVLFLWGGFNFLTGAGSDDREKAEKGKKIITSALVGFLIIFAAYWIIQLVELITGVNIL